MQFRFMIHYQVVDPDIFTGAKFYGLNVFTFDEIMQLVGSRASRTSALLRLVVIATAA